MLMDSKEAKRDARVEVTLSEGPGKQSSRLKETALRPKLCQCAKWSG